MKPFFIAAIIGCAIIAGFPLATVRADTVANELKQQTSAFAGAKGAGLATSRDPRAIASSLVKIFLSFVGTLCLVYFIYAGYLWMTAAGDEEKITKAKHILRNSTVGVLLVLSAYSIALLLQRILIPGSSDIISNENINVRLETNPYTGCEGPNADPLKCSSAPFEISPFGVQTGQ